LNFFEAQDKARRNTLWLVLLFVLAVAGLILLTNLFLLSILVYVKTRQIIVSPEMLYYYFSWKEFTVVSTGICLLVFSGSLYKARSLSGGGPTVAEMLGGRLVSSSTTNLQHRRLLNVIEEMAIAAGMPIPQVYLLSETSINAFAAGLSPANAVIGITEGTLQRLNREELQGVIAHEFSHIANGDMRLNIRLIGMLHGILLIGLIGSFLVRSLRFAGGSRNKKGAAVLGAIVAVGIGLMIIGYAGSFFGQWIKAIVSRQREYLADSSAVQFTRNKDGIADALKKIGGSAVGSYISSPFAPQYSHAYFVNGISFLWQPWFATHPPLERRIKRIEPTWDGEFLKSVVSKAPPFESAKVPPSSVTKLAMTAAILSSAEQAIGQVGTLNEANIEYAHQLIIAMPLLLREAAQDAYSARILIYAALIHLQNDKAAALAVVAPYPDPDMQALLDKYLPELKTMDDRFKLPLLELCINALRELSPNQFVQFKTAVANIIASDKSVNLREWIIQRFVVQQLDQHFGFREPPKAKHASLDMVSRDVETLLSLIAWVEHNDAAQASAAFASGTAEAKLQNLELLAAKALKLESLDRALDNLMQLRPLVKPRLLKGCVALIMKDGRATTRGIELVRTISTCLDCPMPPMRAQ
jgi:Zn-dependent protease with chaperone function